MKKAFVSVLLLIVILLSSISSLATNNTTSTVTRTASLNSNNVTGNTCGNLMNGGIAAISGDWIYYTLYDGPLCKINTKGTLKVKLCNDKARGINVIGEWVYYYNYPERAFYKIKTDGTNRKKLCNAIAMPYVVGDWIYYAEDYIYKIKTDGTSRTRISNSKARKGLNVSGNWIYFYYSVIDYNHYTGSSGPIYKIKTDGAGLTKICNDKVNTINTEGDWVYYVNVSDKNIYKIKTDGTKRTKLTSTGDINDITFNVSGNWIYYLDHYGLCKMKIDGSHKSQLAKYTKYYYFDTISVVGDWIYYIFGKYDGTSVSIYKMKTDGTAIQKVS